MADIPDLMSAVAYAHQQAAMYERDHNDKQAAKRLRRVAGLLMLSGQLDLQAASVRAQATEELLEILSDATG